METVWTELTVCEDGVPQRKPNVCVQDGEEEGDFLTCRSSDNRGEKDQRNPKAQLCGLAQSSMFLKVPDFYQKRAARQEDSTSSISDITLEGAAESKCW